jgi:hypothetical protein
MRRLVKQGDIRPMENQADAMSGLRQILAERYEFNSRAHASVDTNGRSIKDCVAELVRITPQGTKKKLSHALQND